MHSRLNTLPTISWVVGCFLVCGALQLAGVLDGLERRSEDDRLRRGPKPPIDSKIVIVEIDTASLQEDRLGKAPWRPAQYAAILKRLKELGAAEVAFDIVLEHVYEPADLELAREMHCGATEIVLASQWTTTERERGTEERWTLPAKEFRRPAEPVLAEPRVGFANLPVDRELIRDTWLLRRHPVFDDQLIPSFATALAQVRGDVESPLRIMDGELATKSGRMPLAGSEERGTFARIYYAGPRGSFPTVNVQHVMGLVPHPTLEPLIRDATVLVGATAPEYHDLHDTPMNRLSTGAEQRMSGVEIHANILNMLRVGRAPRRCSNLVAAGFALLLVLPFLWIALNIRPLGSFLILPLWLTGHWHFTQIFYDLFLIFLPVVGPVLLMVTIWCGAVVIRWATVQVQQTKMRNLFSRCVHDSVISDLMNKPLGPALEGQCRRVTVFFSDIRGFTQLSEQITPQQMVRLLREYFEAMCEVIYAHKGAVDKFIGDAIMAFFGTPHDDPDHARHAVQCALAMQHRLGELQRKWAQEGWPTLSIAFGINTGPVVAGMLGSTRKMEYTVIGDTVNVASRLECLNKEFNTSILMTAETRQTLGDEFELQYMGLVPLRGKAQPVAVYAATSLPGKRCRERDATGGRHAVDGSSPSYHPQELDWEEVTS